MKWKTTIAGVLTIVIAVANAALAVLNGDAFDIAATITAVTAGAGVIGAGKIVSDNATAKKEEEE
ncbi:MAG TPA: hypothetical protein VNQ90_02905 [Chthoniobacteraceae bacterium]|nr:hypothetical protein [Chthoniobacteraceae bacterium]